MRAARLLTVLTLLACAPPSAAYADWLATPFVGLKFGASGTFVDLDRGSDNTKLTLGGELSWIGDGLLGVEADFGFTPRFFDPGPSGLVTSSSVTTLTGNVLVLVPRSLVRETLRPYVVGGAGWMHVGSRDISGALEVDSNLLGMTVGGGAIGPLSERTSLRFELRYFKNLTDDPNAPAFGRSSLSFWRATVGVSFSL